MAMTMSQNSQKSRFQKLSLKKNKLKDIIKETKESDKSSELIILDDTFDTLKLDSKNHLQPPKIYSPIVLDDSSDDTVTAKENRKMDNISFNCSHTDVSMTESKDARPSVNGCWSPAQSIICATPKQHIVPSTPKDKINESLEECSIKKIHNSQQKLLTELYGDVWKSIPRLFRTEPRRDNDKSGCTKKLDFDDDSDKENNIRTHLKETKDLYLTGSDAKTKVRKQEENTEKKSKKKLYTERIPNTPDPVKTKIRLKRDVCSTTKKVKGKSVTELVDGMKDKFEVDTLAKRIENVSVKITKGAPIKDIAVGRLSFVASLTENVPHWRCHPEAFAYKDNYNNTKEALSRRLYEEFNRNIFDDGLDADMPILWDTKLRSTAGTTMNRRIKSSNGDITRVSSIKLSCKVVDTPARLRDTLVHEMCHAATWLVDHEQKAGHGPLWKKWATRALKVYPELGEISRCHNLEIHFKYSYKCTKCGYTIRRHSKSLDITKKCCGYCRGTFQLLLNKRNKDGVVVSTPARQGEVNDFAKYVKQHYGDFKNGRTHAQVMKMLGEQFSEKKRRPQDDS